MTMTVLPTSVRRCSTSNSFVDPGQHLCHGAQEDLFALARRELHVVQLDRERVDQQPLHDLNEAGDVAGEVSEELAVLARIGDDAVFCVVFERNVFGIGHLVRGMLLALIFSGF